MLALTLGWGLLGVYVAAIVSGVLRSLVLVALNLAAGLRPAFPFDREVGLPLLINSAPLALSAFLTLAYQHADKLMTTRILDETITGYLTAAFVINFGAIELFSTSVLVAAYPLLARYYDEGRNAFFGFMIEKLALYMVIIGLPLALSISILADKIILPLLGQAYAPSAEILRLLIWFTAITMFGKRLQQGLADTESAAAAARRPWRRAGAQCRADGDSAIQLGRCARRRHRVHHWRSADCRVAPQELPRKRLVHFSHCR